MKSAQALTLARDTLNSLKFFPTGHLIYNVGIAIIMIIIIIITITIMIINHPPFITIFMGAINHQKWVVYGIAVPTLQAIT